MTIIFFNYFLSVVNPLFNEQKEGSFRKELLNANKVGDCWNLENANYYSVSVNWIVDNKTFRGSSSTVAGFFTIEKTTVSVWFFIWTFL